MTVVQRISSKGTRQGGLVESDTFIGELRRALLTEEEMSTTLLDLTSTALQEHEADAAVLQEAGTLLDDMRAETSLHAETVRSLIARLTEGSRHG